ncbi:MAG TPA: hypothetical protein VGY48_34775 [Vicinamibacterales bacterium]|jgi:hypothetical protein|nr:hypothetical protein [Vicinamibacterales bacterium]
MTLCARSADAQDTTGRIDALQQVNGSVEALVQGVGQSVVQVIVTTYGPPDEAERSMHRSSGSRPKSTLHS